jgi:hypothetical protein
MCAWLSRLMLLLVAIELVTMPLTQQLWSWDGFGRGEQDFELGLFMVVACVCLSLLRAQHCRQRISLLLVIVRYLFEAFRERSRAGLLGTQQSVQTNSEHLFFRTSRRITTPLLI